MMKKPEGFTLANYQMEYRKMRMGQEKIIFNIHLTAYIIVNALLTAYNLLSVPTLYWFVYPLIFWGIGVTVNYTFCVRRFEKRLKAEEAKIEHIVNS